MSHRARILLLVVVAALMPGCWGGPRHTLGLRNGTLAPCPSSPNCVHTGLRHPQGTTGMFARTTIPPQELMTRIADVVAELPGTEIVTQNDRYLHAEVTSRIFRFVDDLEIAIVGDSEIVVRSSSRVGRSDLGVNRNRVEDLRSRLTAADVLR